MFRERFQSVRAELVDIDTQLKATIENDPSEPQISVELALVAASLRRLVRILVRVIDSLP